MSFDYGRKPEFSEEAHVDTGRACKLQHPNAIRIYGLIVVRLRAGDNFVATSYRNYTPTE